MSTYKKLRSPIALLLVVVLMLAMVPNVFAADELVIPDATLISDKRSEIGLGDVITFTSDITNDGTGVWSSIKFTFATSFLQINSVKQDNTSIDYTVKSNKLSATLNDVGSKSTSRIVVVATVISEPSIQSISYVFSYLGKDANATVKGAIISISFFPYTNISAAPVIDAIYEGDKAINGDGVADAIVYVTLPSGNTYEVTVNSEGRWTLDADEVSTLKMGQVVKAYQVETGKFAGDEDTETVQKNQNHTEDSEKTSVVRDGESYEEKDRNEAKIGDIISYTITLTNNATESSTWDGVMVKDTLPTGVTLISGSVKLDGQLLTSGTGYSYDTSSRTLTVEIGTINGGVTKTLTFDTRIEKEAGGTTVENVAKIGENEVPDPEPIPVVNKSEDPDIDEIFETDDTVTGCGVKDATVVVTFPSGATEEAIVDENGEWTVNVPETENLQPGQKVSAIQTEVDKEPSDKVEEEVQPNTNVIKDAAKSSKNVDRDDELANVNDTIRYTITAQNLGTASSTWADVVITDAIPSGVTYVADSVTINGVSVTSPDVVSYTSGTLTVKLGSLVGGSDVQTVTFDVTIDSDSYGKTIENIADVGGLTVKDTNLVKIIEQSAMPNINQIMETDTTILGTSTAAEGSKIVVTFPDGVTTIETTVDADGNWSVEVPENVTLQPYETVTAVQTETGKAPSAPDYEVVQPDYTPVISLDKTWENLITDVDNNNGKSNIGDTIRFTIIAKNEGRSLSSWSCIITDKLHEGFTFVNDSVYVNGTKAYYTLDDNNTLTIDLGNISGGEERIVTFQVVINEKAYGQEIYNTVVDVNTGKEDETDEPIDVIDKSKQPTIDEVLETDDTIYGQGEPNAEIVVTFPDGSTEETTVDEDGNWSVPVPEDVDLKPGDEITAVQTENGKDPSDPETAIVQADEDFAPYVDVLNKTNVSDLGSTSAKAGDILLWEYYVTNNGTASSITPELNMVIKLDDDTTFHPLVMVNGVSIQTYTYDSESHTLTIPVGSIQGGVVRTFSFMVKANSNVAVINNLMMTVKTTF